MVDRSLAAAAALFTASTVYGAVVSLRHDVVGEPLRVRPPGSVAQHLAVGLGAGLSAPWPMPVAAIAAAGASGRGATWPGRLAVTIGVVNAAGVLVEPVTWQRRWRSWQVWLSVALNLASASSLIAAGRRVLAASR